MSTALVVATTSDAYSRPVVAATRAGLRDDVSVIEVGDDLDLVYGAQSAASSGAHTVVCIGALIGSDASLQLPAVTQSLLSLGLQTGVPVLSAVAAFANDMVARRADSRAVADAIVARVNALSGGGGGRPSAAVPKAATTSRGVGSAPPPPSGSSSSGGYGGGPYATASGGKGSGSSGFDGGAGSGGATGGVRRAAVPPPSANPITGAAASSPGTSSPYRGPARNTSDARGLGVDAALAMLRENLKKRGANGIFGLGRKFKIMDDDGSKSINMAEFLKAMRETEVNLDEATLRKLFSYFDNDGSGTIDYDEFLVGVRGELNERRKALVQLAFNVVDKDGSGVLDLSDIMGAYDASKHPEVIAGKKTKNEVFREFLDNFDGGEKDGTVTPDEFERYYATLSASIDSDDYFELMIRNAWHISGGEGWSQNTTCRRVLVTRRDGSQQVVEIKNDIGLGNDLNAIKAALKRQGEEFTAVSLFGVDDTTTPSARPGTAPTGRFGTGRNAHQSQIRF